MSPTKSRLGETEWKIVPVGEEHGKSYDDQEYHRTGWRWYSALHRKYRCSPTGCRRVPTGGCLGETAHRRRHQEGQWESCNSRECASGNLIDGLRCLVDWRHCPSTAIP